MGPPSRIFRDLADLAITPSFTQSRVFFLLPPSSTFLEKHWGIFSTSSQQSLAKSEPKMSIVLLV